MKKRFFSLLMALCLCLTLLPPAARAGDTEPVPLTQDMFTSANADTSPVHLGEVPYLSTAYTLDPGSYRLDTNITLSHRLCINNAITLDLNGYTITLSDGYNDSDLIHLYGSSSVLEILDSSEAKTGSIDGKNQKRTQNPSDCCIVGVLATDGDFTLTSGTITNCTDAGVSITSTGEFIMNGGTICNCNYSGVYVTGSSFTMNGGTITNCCVDTTASAGHLNITYGGGVHVNARGHFTMTGGSITNCNAVQQSDSRPFLGGGVYIGDGSHFTLGEAGKTSTVTITGNTVNGSTPCNVLLNATAQLTIAGALSEDSSVGVSLSENYPTDTKSPLISAEDYSFTEEDTAHFFVDGDNSKGFNREGQIGNRVTVSFDSRGGSTVDSQTVVTGNHVAKPTNPTKNDFRFGGWYYVASDGTKTKWDFGTDTVTGEMTLQASWESEYTVQYYAMNPDGSYPTEPTPVTQHGEAGTTAEVPSHYLTGWLLDREHEGSVLSGTITEDGSLTLVAYFARRQYPVTFDANGGSFEDGSTTVSSQFYYQQPLSMPTAAPSREGYSFLYWDTELETMPAQELTIYAKWQRVLRDCTITVNPVLYTGSAVEPDITITDGDKTLVYGTDYTFLKDGDSVTSATAPGSYELTIRGMWDYSGDITVRWSILDPSPVPTVPPVQPSTPSVPNTSNPSDTPASEPEPSPISNPFVDVSTEDYYYDAVLWAVETDITGGMDTTHFGPAESCTRAQLASFLYRYAQSQGKGFTGAWMFQLPFTDVSDWCYEAVAWCYMNDIVSGYGDDLFGTDDEITREQVVTILYRFAQTMDLDTTQGGMAIREYADYESISDYAVAAMQWAVNIGILQGADGQLLPQDSCSRAQIMTMLYRFCEQLP